MKWNKRTRHQIWLVVRGWMLQEALEAAQTWTGRLLERMRKGVRQRGEGTGKGKADR